MILLTTGASQAACPPCCSCSAATTVHFLSAVAKFPCEFGENLKIWGVFGVLELVAVCAGKHVENHQQAWHK
jgi:hypothetical protein